MLDLRRIRYFVAAYEEGSIKRAALRENVVQPAVSVQIKQLEAELSLKLFERSAQGIQPTAAGHHLYRLAADILRRVQSGYQEMLDYTGAVAGSIAVGIMPSLCRGPMPGIVAAYASAYPGVDLKLVEGFSGPLVDRVLAGELDLAICNRPSAQTRLKLNLLARDKLVLVSGRDTSLTPWAPCRLEDLSAIRFILPSSEHNLRRLLDREFKRSDFRPARILEMDALGLTFDTMRAGGWSTIVPRIAVVNDLVPGTFVINPLVSTTITSDIYELRLPERAPPLAAQRLTQLVAASLADVGKAFQTAAATYHPA